MTFALPPRTSPLNPARFNMVSITEYKTPAPHLAYSQEDFNRMSIQNVLDDQGHYPQMASPQSISQYSWSTVVPYTAASIIVAPCEVIPCFEDIQIILAQLESQFNAGYRSVHVDFRHRDTVYHCVYHFSKLTLIKNIANHDAAFKSVPRLLAHLEAAPFCFDQTRLDLLRKSRFLAPIQGFHTTPFRLHELSVLLEEQWLNEDVLNALAELNYFRQFAISCQEDPSLIGNAPPNLFLPTSFWTDTLMLYSSSHPTLSAELLALQHRIRSTVVESIGVLCADGSHFTGFHLEHGDDIISYGDSLHLPPPPNLLPAFSWFLQATGRRASKVEAGGIDRQGGDSGGEGSCSIAALNFLETRVNKAVPMWGGSQSRLFRDLALDDLVRFHLLAVESGETFHDWVELACPGLEELLNGPSVDVPGMGGCFTGLGYREYNLYKPKRTHLSFQLIEDRNSLRNKYFYQGDSPDFPSLSAVTLGWTFNPLTNSRPQTPERTLLPSNSPSGSLKRVRTPASSPSPSPRPKRPQHAQRSPSLEVVGITTRPIQSAPVKQEPREPVIKLEPAIDLTFSTGRVKAEVFSPIDLTSPSPIVKTEEDASMPLKPLLVDFTSPLMRVKQERGSPVLRGRKSTGLRSPLACTKAGRHGSTWELPIDLITPPPRIKREPGINPIDLASPTLRSRVKRECTAATIKPEPFDPPIDLTSSPPVKQEPSSTSTAVKMERSVEAAPALPRLNEIYTSLDDAQKAIYTYQEKLGFQWRRGQSKVDARTGLIKKLTFRCNRYYTHQPTHRPDIDPSDWRESKTVKTGCMARVNVNRVGTSQWRITTINYEHNHPPPIPVGGTVRRPALPSQVEAIATLATNRIETFNRSQLSEVIRLQNPGAPILEPRQISNIMNAARAQARKDIDALGGDFNAIIANLEEKALEDGNWQYRLKVDADGVVTGLIWVSPLQYELGVRFYDVLINDSSYNRNTIGYPLSIGIIIDNFCSSRNVFYALLQREDTEHVTWMLRSYTSIIERQPTTFLSDRHATIISVVPTVLPLTFHLYCLSHLMTNIDQNLRSAVGADWIPFKRAFDTTYRSVSPEEFDRNYNSLVTMFPRSRDYLDRELYPCREHWAYCWVSMHFTAGATTNGRVESENRVTKAFSGPKKSPYQLYESLNMRTDGQSVQEMIRVRNSSRRQHSKEIESVFPSVLRLLREHAGPFALQTSYLQMERSMYYRTDPIHLPEGFREWTEDAVQSTQEPGFQWVNGEENNMLNSFSNDTAYIATAWLLRLISGRGLRVERLVKDTGNPRVNLPLPVPVPAPTRTRDPTGIPHKTSPRTSKTDEK